MRMGGLIGLNSIFIIGGVTVAQAWIVRENAFRRGALVLALLVGSITMLLVASSAPAQTGARGPELSPAIFMVPIFAGCITFLVPGAWLLHRYGHEQIPAIRYAAL